MQGGVPQGSQIDESGLPMCSLQRQSQIYSHRGGAASALGVDHRKDLAPRTLLSHPPLGGGEAYEGFQKVGGGGGTLNELTRAGPHGIDDHLGLIKCSDGEDRGLGHLQVEQFNGSQSHRRIVGGNVDQGDVGIGSAYAASDWILGSNGEAGASVCGARYAGAI